MANTTVNKVILGNETLLDLTGDTATAADVASGKMFHLASGAQAVGTASGGGGASAWTHIAHAEFEVSTTSGSPAAVGTVACGSGVFGASKIIYVMVRDKAGARNDHFCGSDTIMFDHHSANGDSGSISRGGTVVTRRSSTGAFATNGFAMQSAYGVYPFSISSGGGLALRSRYSSSSTYTIDGTYTVDVFTLDYPSGYRTPFDVISE